MSSQTDTEFSKLRAALWPIHGHEMKKFLPMAAILFFVLFNYTVVRALKDVLISTAPNSGAEVFNFLKFWVVLPSSIAFVVVYAKLSNMFSREKLYYLCLLPFPIFFAVFTFLIHPNAALLHPDPASIRALQEAYPNFQWFFPVYGNWAYSLFYTFAELWGNVGTAIIFWQFANEVTRTAEAKRFYSLFGFLANFALIVAGRSLNYFKGPEDFPILMSIVVAAGVAIALIYGWMNKAVLSDPRYYEKAAGAQKKKDKKPKLSIAESFKLLIHSKYLGYIAILVLGYGMTINMIEVTWKNQVRELYPNPKDLQAFFGDFYAWVGIATIILMFTTKGLVRRFGWFTGAVTTPTMIFITGSLFFALVLVNDFFPGSFALMDFTPLFLAVLIGAAQNILSKGTKYSLFDPTKEMAYIPLDQELKVKGKAAVDVIGSRLGKSGGGVVQQILLIVTAGNQLTIAPALAGFVLIIVLVWIWAVKKLSVEYNTLVDKKPNG